MKRKKTGLGLPSDERGNSLVELALIMPVALMLFGGLIDFSRAVSQRLQAQQAVARTLELVANTGLADLTEEGLRAEAARAADLPVERVTVRIWLECDGVAQTNPAAGCASSDGLARFASVTIENTFDLSFYASLANVVRTDDMPGYRVQGSLRIQ